MRPARAQNGRSESPQLKATQAQLQIYARDFGELLQRERDKTAQVEAAFRARFADIQAFENDASVGTLVLS